MKEITETREVIVGYEAMDGTRFDSKEECIKYDNSARVVIETQARKLMIIQDWADDLLINSYSEDAIEVFKPQNLDEIEAINRYFNLFDAWGEPKLISPNDIDKYIITVWNYDHDGYTLYVGIESILEEIESNWNYLFEKHNLKGEKTDARN